MPFRTDPRAFRGGRLTTTSYSDTTPSVTLAYDSLGRKISETQANRSAFTFTYNPTTLAPATESIAYDLNADGIPDFTRVLDRSRDTLGRESGWQLKNGAAVENAVTYNFDTAGRLGNVTSPAGSFTYAYNSNSMGLINSVTGPAHIVTNTWDPTRDVLTRKQNKAGATIISAYDYSVNALGQRTNVANTGSAFASARSIAWGYDSLGQVTKADSSVSGFDRAYQYDGIGNRKKAANSLTLPTADNYTSNVLNQYTAVGTLLPTYDDDGNATAYPVPTRLTANSTLTWDAENRIRSANVNGVTTTYLYDSGSRRIAQTTGTTTTVYVYDGWNPVAEYTGSTLKKAYTWGSDLSGSLQGAGGVGGLLAVTDQVAVVKPSYFPTFDGNGNVSEYLTSAGANVAHYEYDPFGRSTTSTGTLATSFAHRFSTKPVDGPTGLYYYGYRYYDPATGRWPSKDPIEEEGGVNLYGFVGNDSVYRSDLLGLECTDGRDVQTPAGGTTTGTFKTPMYYQSWFGLDPYFYEGSYTDTYSYDWVLLKSRSFSCSESERNVTFTFERQSGTKVVKSLSTSIKVGGDYGKKDVWNLSGEISSTSSLEVETSNNHGSSDSQAMTIKSCREGEITFWQRVKIHKLQGSAVHHYRVFVWITGSAQAFSAEIIEYEDVIHESQCLTKCKPNLN